MNTKSGWKTTEFWITIFLAVAAPVIGILAGRGVLSPEESTLVTEMVEALAPIAGIVVSGFIAGRYVNSRSEVKAAVSWRDFPHETAVPVEPLNHEDLGAG